MLIGLAISLGALYLALRDVHWRDVGGAIRDANYGLVALAAALLSATLVLRALRWRLLFHPLRGLRLWHLFGALNVAYLINNIAPFQVGDLGRAYLLSELEKISATRALSTVVVERILDVLTLLLLLLVLALFIDVPSWARTPSLVLAAVTLGVAAALALATLRRAWALAFVDRLLRFAPGRVRPKLNQMAHSALDGFAVLASPRIALALAAWSVVLWLVVGVVLFVGMRAFDLDTGFGAALLVLVATTFGFFVPSSPGSFGVYHAITIGTLTSVFDVPKHDAVSYALVIHLVFYLPPMAIASGFLLLERHIWSQIDFFAKLREVGSLPGEELDRVAVSDEPSRVGP